MESELLTILGHIPAPDDRDLAAQLATIERCRCTCYTHITIIHVYRG